MLGFEIRRQLAEFNSRWIPPNALLSGEVKPRIVLSSPSRRTGNCSIAMDGVNGGVAWSIRRPALPSIAPSWRAKNGIHQRGPSKLTMDPVLQRDDGVFSCSTHGCGGVESPSGPIRH
jgi:hypothetical protein